MKKLVIIGAGDLGKEVSWLVSDLSKAGEEVELVGFVDDDPKKHSLQIYGFKVLGSLSWLEDKADEFLAVLAVGDIFSKKNIVKQMHRAGIKFYTLIHPQVIKAENVKIGEGSIIFPGVVLSVNVKVGKFVLLNPGITLSHDVEIGDWTLVGAGVHLAGGVKVGKECELGTSASAIPRVQIADRVILGAGAVAIRNLPEGVVAVGVPAKVIKERTD